METTTQEHLTEDMSRTTEPGSASTSQPPVLDSKTITKEIDDATHVAKVQSSCRECTIETRCQRHIFPFLDLPTELRVNVYQHALLRDDPVYLARELPAIIAKTEPSHRQLQADAPRRRRIYVTLGPSNTNERHDANSERNKRVPRPTPDPLCPKILLLCKQIHHEALPVMYRDNVFNLDLEFSLLPLTTLKQRTRSLIKHVIINVHEHNEVLNGGFSDIFTNGLRYCFGLQKLEIVTKVPMPRDRSYDLNFHILRWLPKACKVKVKGERVSEGVKKMVDEQNILAEKLDLVGTSILSRNASRIQTFDNAGSLTSARK